MIEALKEILTQQLSNEVVEYNNCLSELKKMEDVIVNDSSEQDYISSLKVLKKQYGIKRIFNSKLKKEYNEKFKKLREDYDDNLKQFGEFYDKYESLKRTLAKWNIYKVNKQIENIPKYKTLKDFKLSSEEIKELLKKANFYDKLTSEEILEIDKMSSKK